MLPQSFEYDCDMKIRPWQMVLHTKNIILAVKFEEIVYFKVFVYISVAARATRYFIRMPGVNTQVSITPVCAPK